MFKNKEIGDIIVIEKKYSFFIFPFQKKVIQLIKL